jgi:hypothetical protein
MYPLSIALWWASWTEHVGTILVVLCHRSPTMPKLMVTRTVIMIFAATESICRNTDVIVKTSVRMISRGGNIWVSWGLLVNPLWFILSKRLGVIVILSSLVVSYRVFIEIERQVLKLYCSYIPSQKKYSIFLYRFISQLLKSKVFY